MRAWACLAPQLTNCSPSVVVLEVVVMAEAEISLEISLEISVSSSVNGSRAAGVGEVAGCMRDSRREMPWHIPSVFHGIFRPNRMAYAVVLPTPRSGQECLGISRKEAELRGVTRINFSYLIQTTSRFRLERD